MDLTADDPKMQVKAVAADLKAMNVVRLYDAIDTMSTSLVMGFESYLRRFDSTAAIPVLTDVCETFMKENTQGDLLLISLRALSLILEHVPSSYEAAQMFHRTLIKLTSQAIHKALCSAWVFQRSNKESLIEEALRVMRFVGKDDMTGELLQHIFVGDLLTLCTDAQPLVSRQSLETLLMLTCKVVMPSELEKPTHSVASGILSFFKSRKKLLHSGGDTGSASGGTTGSASRGSTSSKAAATEDIVPHADHPIVVLVENLISPLLVSLIERYVKSLASIPEHWGILELSLQCLGTLMERALICHRPHTARAVASPLLPRILFKLMVDTESNVALEPSVRVDRVLLCETTLTVVTYCHRSLMLESLQLPEARAFFKLILEDSFDEITTVLDDPFPRALIAARNTQRRDKDHITSIAALQLLVLACPTVPLDAFGLKPKLVFPVHQWMWEDELRHNNRLMEEQCVSLETSWSRLDHHASIFVHRKQLEAELRSMTLSKGSHGGRRNICRSYVPFVFHFMDEAALRPLVAVKDAGPSAIDGMTLVWVSATPVMKNKDGTENESASVKECGASFMSQGSSKSSRRKDLSSSRKLPEMGVVNSSGLVARAVVLNTQLEVPPQHLSLAAHYFLSLCVFAQSTSGQMAKQVATSACASMLQLMLLSKALEQFADVMGLALLPMCEMFRDALISADKATKAVVLTMTEWMLYHPMAQPCAFAESSLRCGLLHQLDCLSKTTPLAFDKPTRTQTLVDKATALANCIVERIGRQRVGQTGSSGSNVSAAGSPGPGRGFLSVTMLKVRNTLAELQACQCGRAYSRTDTACSDATAAHAAAGISAGRGDTHEPAIRTLLQIFHESSGITAHEVVNVGLGSIMLYYLLGDHSFEELVGETVVYSSGATASTSTRDRVAQPDSHTGPLHRTASSWASMMASGVHVADILAMHVVEERMHCIIRCARAYPVGMRRLVSTLVATMARQSSLPLVESVVTYDKVVCKTPLQVHEALCTIAPMIMLCGEAGQQIADVTRAAAERNRAQRGVSAAGGSSPSPTPMHWSVPSPFPGPGAPARQRLLASLMLPVDRSGAMESSSSVSVKAMASNAAVLRIAKECCVRGHRLHFMEHGQQTRQCSVCQRGVYASQGCGTCSFQVCEDCYPSYDGNINLIKMLMTYVPNRVHLCAAVGDVERWLRTGSTTLKGTELSPTSQSSLNHLGRFTTRVMTFLKRYTVAAEGPAFGSISQLGGAVSSLSSSPSATPQRNRSSRFDMAQKLLRNPIVVRRLTYKYLSRFANRGALIDEFTPIEPELAAALDFEAQKLLTTDAERRAAEDLVQEGVEERYILYRSSCGMLPFQETMLSILYRRAFALGDHQVLLQLENCLMRLDGTGETTLKLPLNSNVTMANPTVSATRRQLGVKNAKKGKAASSFLTTASAESCSLPPGGSLANATPPFPDQATGFSAGKSSEGREFEGHCVALDQTYVFHHFECDSAPCCACGAHSRVEFHTKEPPALSFATPELAQCPDLLLLILLHRVFFKESAGFGANAEEVTSILGGDDSIFQNSTITTTLVRSLEASALRVSLLPPCYALPRWVNFLLRDARFLIPLPVRERVARFLAYGARRCFVQHMRAFRSQRNDRTVTILPGEWAKTSNHKFSVSRDNFLGDAYKMLRKCADSRFSISVVFKGDVGVGQGPTAQFYTLLASEVSKCKAELWRSAGGEAARGDTLVETPRPSGATNVTGSIVLGSPPSSLPPRRSSVTPLASPSRLPSSRPNSVSNRLPGSGSRTDHTVVAAPTSTSACSYHPTVKMAGPEENALAIAPPEGFYPRHLQGVRRYLDDADSVPSTPLLRRNHSQNLRDEGEMNNSVHRSGGPLLTTPKAKGGHINPHGEPSSVAPASSTGSFNHSNRLRTGTLRADATRAAVLLDSNVGLLRDYVLEQRERAKAYYVVGAALGRAFTDEQVFPLALSPAVAYFIGCGVPPYRYVLPDTTHAGELKKFPIDLFELPLTAVSWVDLGVARSLTALSKMDAASLDALELPFTLPGDDKFELVPGGARMTVTKHNLRLYQRRVVGALLYESVAVPLYFMTMGCRDVVNPEALIAMEVKELIAVLCGENKHPNEPLWTTEEIRSVLVGDHGYQNDSPQLESLAKVLGERLTPVEQREFLLFCTGCPRLPIGGIRALGAITVVRRSNAFAEARTAAQRAESLATTTSVGERIVSPDGDAEEDESPFGGLCDAAAPSEGEDCSSGRQETPRRILSSMGNQNLDDLGGISAAMALRLSESEWALPSVNTCFRYLKLPPYPTEDLLYTKLRMSISQAGGTFELS